MANQHRNFLRSSVIFVAVFVAYECCFGTTFTGTHTRSTPPGGARNCVALKGSAVGVSEMFEDFTKFLKMKQEVIIGELESIENEEHRFTRDPWGCFLEEKNKSGGLTRVLQGGTVIEKGACSFTVIRGGLLSAERAKSISARQGGDLLVQAGDAYAAAALSTWEGGEIDEEMMMFFYDFGKDECIKTMPNLHVHIEMFSAFMFLAGCVSFLRGSCMNGQTATSHKTTKSKVHNLQKYIDSQFCLPGFTRWVPNLSPL